MYRLLLSSVLLLLAIVTVCSSQDDPNCFYYYTSQPSSDTTCNPWPLITNNNTLALNCNIRAPQNNELPNIRWFMIREEGTGQEMLYPGGSTKKYINPISSRDVSTFKRVNFSLIINDVSETDIGCYLCEVHVTSENGCWFDIRPSTQFCLLGEDDYIGKDPCESIPINNSLICASNMTCEVDSLTITQTGMPLVTTIKLPQLSSSSITLSSLLATESEQSQLKSLPHNTIVALPTIQQSTASESVAKESDSLKSMVKSTNAQFVSSDTTTIMNSQTNNSESSNKRLSMQHSSSQERTSTTNAVASSGLGQGNIGSRLPLVSTTAASNQLQLRIGLYIGVGVCSLLLVVILILLAAVAILCRKKSPGMKRLQENRARSSTSVSSQGPEESRIWTRTHSSQPTAIVNDEGVLHLLNDQFPRPSDEILTSNIDHLPTNTTSERRTRDQNGSAGQVRGGQDSVQHTPKAVSSLKRSKRHFKGSPSHHRLSLTNGHAEEGHMTNHTWRTNTLPTSRRPSSPETHYYHVLEEEPRYYNFNWLARNTEGRELLVQNRNRGGNEEQLEEERTIPSPTSSGDGEVQDEEVESARHSSTPQYDYADIPGISGNINGDDHISKLRPQIVESGSPTERDQYHWTVLLSPSKKSVSEERRPSAKKQNRQMYARLDCSTIEPKREYTQVNITQKDDS